MTNKVGLNRVKNFIVLILVTFSMLALSACDTDELLGSLANISISRLRAEGYQDLAMKKNDEMLKRYPRSVSLLNSKAFMLIEAGDYENALEVLDMALNVTEDNDVALNNKAWVLVKLGKAEEALALLEQSFESGHRGVAEYNTQANAYLELDRFDEAIKSYGMALEIDPKFYGAFYGKGATYYEQEFYVQAASEFEQYVKSNPSDINGYDYLGYSYYYASETQKALDISEITIQKFPNSVLGYLMKADCLSDSDQPKAAIRVLEDIKNRFSNPSDVENIFNRLGDLYYITLDYKKSTEAYEKCLEILPDSVYYMLQIGYNCLDTGEQAKLDKIIEKALHTDPENGEAYNLKGLSLAYQTFYKDSIPLFETALEKGSDPEETSFNIAWALYMSKQLSKCYDYCMEQIPKREDPSDFYYYAAQCKERLFELEDASFLYLEALELSKDNEDALSSLASVYFQQHDLDMSMEYVRKTLDVNPNNVTAVYLLNLLEGYKEPLSKQTAEFFKENYLYKNEIEHFDELCDAFSKNTDATAEDVEKFIEETKWEQDPYTYVITDSIYKDQFDSAITTKIITEVRNNVYFYKFRDFTYTIGYDFIDFVNEIQNPEDSVLILDVRDNGGGLIQGAVDMLDCLLGNKEICATVDRNQITESYFSDGDQIRFKHIYIFVNQNTASASELLTLSLRKNINQVTVIGTPTLGKGVGQTVYIDEENSMALVTVNFHWNVKEENINQKPILPDIDHEKLHTLTGSYSDVVIELYEKYQ